MKIAYLSDSLLSSGKANAIHVIKMSQALALEGHSVVLYIRAKSSSSDLKSIVSNQYGVIHYLVLVLGRFQISKEVRIYMVY